MKENPLKVLIKTNQILRHPGKSGTGDKNDNPGEMPQWDLGDLYKSPEDEQLKADLADAESRVSSFADDYKGKLHELAASGASLAIAIREYEALSDILGKAGSYSGLLYATDSTNTAYAKFSGDMRDRLTAISTGLLFFELELNRIDDAVLDKALQNPELAHYKPWLIDIRKERPHQLDDEIERLFMEKSVTGYSAWNRLFDETIAELRFGIDGEELPIAPALDLLSSPDGEKRKIASKALGKTFAENKRIFTQITNTLAKDKEISDKWRRFDDIAASRHLANRVEKEVVDALESAVVEAYPQLSHRYYRLKAKWFGVDKLNHWDRNAPLPDEDTRIISWKKAKSIVLDAYAGFSPEMAEIATRFFENNWIDAPARPGKSPGAFSAATVPSVHPYVLMNYMGRSRDVMTLAHELGHGVHQVLAADQGALMAPTPLTLAETASVFGEMLTFRSLLAGAEDKKTRKALLAGKTEDMLNTVVRQIAFYRFERKLHTMRRTQGELTPQQIGQCWLDTQSESLGSAIKFGEGYDMLWAYVPHFIHSPFYVYAYAFGDCLVNSLYAVYRREPAGFAAKYFDLLRAGGTKHHSELLEPFGLDARNPAFWSEGLKMISGFIDELEEM